MIIKFIEVWADGSPYRVDVTESNDLELHNSFENHEVFGFQGEIEHLAVLSNESGLQWLW